METAIDREGFNFVIFEDDNFTSVKKQSGRVRSAALK
tara:strand:+ start:793 stop:903 length:111 start_codon:yes stop_codon:yes gene_type:complete